MNEIKKEFLALEKKVIKFKKQTKRSDLDYLIQFSVNSTRPSEVKYAIQITPLTTAHGPKTFIKDSLKDMHTALDALLAKELSPRTVEIEYHKAELQNNSKSSEHHQAEIERLESLTDDEFESEQEGGSGV